MNKINKEYYMELAQFLADHYSGQWSRGYRLLCKLRFYSSSTLAEELRNTDAYKWLVEHYANKV